MLLVTDLKKLSVISYFDNKMNNVPKFWKNRRLQQTYSSMPA